MERRRCIAMTGIDTYFGRRLVERWAASGRDLKLLGIDTRDPRRPLPLIDIQRFDLTQPGVGSGLAEALSKEHVDTVVHLAFKTVPTSKGDADRELEVEGSHEVIRACGEAGVRRLVVPSSTMCYGARFENPNRLSEQAALRGHPRAHWVENRVQVEQALSQFCASQPDCDVTVLRHCWIMGPRYLDPFVRFFEGEWVPTLLGHDPLMQFLHEDDWLNVLEAASLDAHPGVFNVVGEGVLPLSGYLRLAGKINLPLPRPLLSVASGSPVSLAATDAADGFFDYLKYMWVASGARARAEFGPPLYTSREAWMAMVGARRFEDYR
ncbi:MAG: NAD-dependent epimerase/dehydratase family protein [bacterium]|nr:NAD-dependent epimerase/dehydratase family protein [bacterium]